MLSLALQLGQKSGMILLFEVITIKVIKKSF